MTNLTAIPTTGQPYTAYEFQYEGETPLDVLDRFAPFDEDEPMPEAIDWDARYLALIDYPACASTFGHPADPEW